MHQIDGALKPEDTINVLVGPGYMPGYPYIRLLTAVTIALVDLAKAIREHAATP